MMTFTLKRAYGTWVVGGLTVLGLSMATAPVAMADALSDNKVVYDRQGNIVRAALSGTCVRTQWEAGTDACAPPAPPAPPQMARVAAPATVIEQEDRTVYFDFDSAVLDANAQRKLDSMARVLQSAQDVKHAMIVGYADRIGNAQYNQQLSAKRAQTVKDYLAKRGYVNTQVAEVRAVGDTQSNTPCRSADKRSELISCLQPDRKVEVEMTYKDNRNVYYDRPVSYNTVR